MVAPQQVMCILEKGVLVLRVDYIFGSSKVSSGIRFFITQPHSVLVHVTPSTRLITAQ